ncbi:MAG: alcohol acetyltransferase [Nostoc sp.]|uniref:phthiocerol/phthiodiolone dimycocerosyl transferase family protein n=1 Tax=Nostoc sp. TaxID=1180 RepID=UPI002FF6A401
MQINSSTLNVNRILSPDERVFEIANQLGGALINVVINRIRGPLSAAIVRQAIDLIQRRHPRLNCRIVGSTDSPRFEEGGVTIPLQLVHSQDDNQWQNIVLQELNQKIESDKYLMRAVLVQPVGEPKESTVSFLIVTLHHGVADGTFCIRLQADILTYCQKIAAGESVEAVARLPVLPALPELFPPSMQGYSGMGNTIDCLLRLVSQHIAHRPETLGFEQYQTPELRRANVVYRQLDETFTQRFNEVYRKEKASEQSALSAAMMLAVANKITGGKKRDICLSCQSFADLRRRLEPVISDEQMGSLASSTFTFHTLKPSMSFWDLARNVKQEIATNIQRNDLFSMMLASGLAVATRGILLNQVMASVGVTKLGLVNISHQYGVFELEEINAVASASAFPGVFVVEALRFQKKMFLNFLFSEPSLSQETIAALADDATAYLADACSD